MTHTIIFMRLFVAIKVNDEIRDKCQEIMATLLISGADLKTTPKENLHITLKFLGEVREDRVNEVKDIIRETSKSSHAFRIGFSVLGYFGGVRFPRVVWLGIDKGKPQIISLSNQLNEKLSFIRSEERSPWPHLTLARVKSVKNSEKLIQVIKDNRDVKLGEVDAKEMSLYSSRLTPNGPIYSEIKTFKLSGV